MESRSCLSDKRKKRDSYFLVGAVHKFTKAITGSRTKKFGLQGVLELFLGAGYRGYGVQKNGKRRKAGRGGKPQNFPGGGA